MIHLRSRGKIQQKIATKLKHDFTRDNAHLAKLLMMPLRARDHAQGRLVVPAKLVETGQAHTTEDQDDALAPTEPMIPDKVMMPMADPGKVGAHTATRTNTLPNPRGNGLVKLETFTNVLTPTTKLTKDIINSIACPGIHARQPRHACGSASVSLNIITMKSMMLICIRSSAADTLKIPRLKSLIDEHYVQDHELRRHNRRLGDRGESGLRYSLAVQVV